MPQRALPQLTGCRLLLPIYLLKNLKRIFFPRFPRFRCHHIIATFLRVCLIFSLIWKALVIFFLIIKFDMKYTYPATGLFFIIVKEYFLPVLTAAFKTAFVTDRKSVV